MSISSNSNTNSNSNSIQEMYDSLISINDWKAAIQSPLTCNNVNQCLDIMNKVTLKDLGLHSINLERINRSFCMHIIQNDMFHMSIFIIPKQCKLPLHDHPNMSVLSKVIKGNLKMRSFNINKDYQTKAGKKLFPATITNNNIKTNSDNSWCLSPSIDNIHDFEASGETVVVLDVLMPPYNDDDGRPCNFYEELVDNGNQFLSVGPEPELPASVAYKGIIPKAWLHAIGPCISGAGSHESAQMRREVTFWL